MEYDQEFLNKCILKLKDFEKLVNINISEIDIIELYKEISRIEKDISKLNFKNQQTKFIQVSKAIQKLKYALKKKDSKQDFNEISEEYKFSNDDQYQIQIISLDTKQIEIDGTVELEEIKNEQQEIISAMEHMNQMLNKNSESLNIVEREQEKTIKLVKESNIELKEAYKYSNNSLKYYLAGFGTVVGTVVGSLSGIIGSAIGANLGAAVGSVTGKLIEEKTTTKLKKDELNN